MMDNYYIEHECENEQLYALTLDGGGSGDKLIILLPLHPSYVCLMMKKTIIIRRKANDEPIKRTLSV